MRERWPDHLFEGAAVELEVERVWVVFSRARRIAGDEIRALWPEVDTGGVDGQRCARDRRAAVEVVDVPLSGVDGKLRADHGRDAGGSWAGCVYHPVAGNRAAVGQAYTGDQPSTALDTAHLAGDVLDA